MRLEALHLERYGIFSDRTLAFHPKANLHVVLGANEAGKTSALSAIGDLLFGFGARTPYDFRHDGKNLRIGGAFRHSDGRAVTARRRKGNKNTLVDDSDQPLPDGLLTPFLDGLTRETFSREFGLTAASLRQGGNELLEAGGRLAETLAASSAGMMALSRVKERLRGEADDLFSPRRSGNKPFYLAADRRDAADKALRESIVTREALESAESAVRDARGQLDMLNAEHAKSGSTLARLQRTLRVRSKLARLEAVDADLASLAGLPPASAQSLAEWRGALESEAEAAREIVALDDADATDSEAIAAFAVDETLLSEGGAIDALRERLGAVRKEIEDLPRRRQTLDAAKASLAAAARRLGLASYGELLDRLPTDPALAHARDMGARLERAEEDLSDADARCARARQERADSAVEDGGAGAIVDPEYLRQRFESLGDIPTQTDRLRRATAALKIDTDALATVAASLDPTPGTLEELRALSLPDSAIVARHARAIEQSESEIARLDETLKSVNTAIANTEVELAKLSSAGAVPTLVDLLGARRERDSHLDALHAVLDGDPASRAKRFSDVTLVSREIDGMTDQLLGDAERATLQADVRQRLDMSIGERARIVDMMAGLKARLAEEQHAWIGIWARSRLAPLGPTEMVRWRERLDDILRRLDKLDAQKADILALESELAVGKDAILSFLESAGRRPDRASPPDVLFREARARLDELQKVWADAKARNVAKARIERDMSEANGAREEAGRALDSLRKEWPAAMAGIGLGGEATPAQAAAAFAVWQSVAVPKASHESESRRVETMEGDLRSFDRDVSDIVDRVAPWLKSASALEAVAQLSETLAGMRGAAASRQQLQAAGARRIAKRNALTVRRSAVATVLAAACQTLCVADQSALPDRISHVARRYELDEERGALLRDLAEIGDGRDEATLRREQEGIDIDLLPGEIDRETVRQKRLLGDISEASALHHQKQGELRTLLNGRNAGAAAAERAEASAELLSIAERWLLREAASRLAARAIERHRAKVQDPLIARAGALLQLATAGAFGGLGIEYGDDDQPILAARRAGGELVKIAGLSEGTRDQLFLALRLALLERRTSEPMPFIGDDLLTSFDEPRTLATLRLLAAAGEQRQIILFTHHRHVADLARDVPGYLIDFIDL